MKYLLPLLILLGTQYTHAQNKRKLLPSDVYRLKSIGDAHVSPEGKWICYTLSSVDSTKDKRNSDVWMVSWDGQQTIQLTNSADSECITERK